MIGGLPESFDDWKTRTSELEGDYNHCKHGVREDKECWECEDEFDNRNSFERAIDKQIELEREAQ